MRIEEYKQTSRLFFTIFSSFRKRNFYFVFDVPTASGGQAYLYIFVKTLKGHVLFYTCFTTFGIISIINKHLYRHVLELLGLYQGL